MVKASFKMSPLYEGCKKLTLHQNMRTDTDEIRFSKFLIKLGEGNIDANEDIGDFCIKIPMIHMVSSLQELIDKVFPNLTRKTDSDELMENAIYTPLNKDMRDGTGVMAVLCSLSASFFLLLLALSFLEFAKHI